MKLHVIETGNFKLDGGAMFGVVPKVIWGRMYPSDENNLCNWSMRSLLVDDGSRKILIDCGIGNKQEQKFLRHYHLNGEATLNGSLEKAGYTPADITDVVITHLHFDHCGGCIVKEASGELVPTFPNASYWVSKEQWEWANNPNGREKASFLKENILPLRDSGKLHLVEEEGELFPGFEVRLFHGHTAGQIIPFVHYNGKTVVFMADLLPSTAHVPLPYVMAYDTRPLITLQEKGAFLTEAADNGYILFFEHDLYHECCTLHQTEKGVGVQETFTLNALD